MRTNWRGLACGVALVAIAACGGGGGAGDGTPTSPPSAAPTLSLAFGIKELRFSWAAVSGATFYRLFENSDGVSGFTQIGGDLAALSHNHTITLYQRVNASYSLQACNSAGCSASSAVVTPGSSLTQAIGYLKASNTGPIDVFGVSLALSADGNTLAVGAMGEASSTTGVNSAPDNAASLAGAVYVFSRNAGAWSQEAYIKASNTGAGDQFGVAVALSADGNTLAVGAEFEDGSTTGVNPTPDEGASAAGAVYVFTRSGGTWSQQAYLKASNAAAGDVFGISVALSEDGNTLAAGAYVQAGSGAAYVFTRTAAVWSQQAFLKASSPANDRFGWSVALNGAGNTLAVGAPFDGSSLAGLGLSGAVYVFIRNAGVWSQQAFVKASNAGSGDQFGTSVALSADGDTLAVGAPAEDSSSTGVNGAQDNNAAPDSGAVYIFTRSGATWSQQAYLKASATGQSDGFGSALALTADGNTLAVGALFEDSGTNGVNSTPDEAAPQSGAVYVYIRSGSQWSSHAYVKAPNPGIGDDFGRVALSGDGSTLAVGAWTEDSSSTGVNSTPNDSSLNTGAVYLY